MDPRTQGVLEAIVRRQRRSLLQYVGESFPWTRAEGQEALARLRHVVEEDGRGVAGLVQYLLRRHVATPYLGSFPGWFTTINFVSLDHLLPLLVDEQEKEVAALQADLGHVADEDARGHVEHVLTEKRRHLEQLKALAPAPAMA